MVPVFRFSASASPSFSTYLGWRNGSVITSPTPYYFSVPDQWQQSGVNWKRSVETRGLIRTTTSPYNFVKDMARILRSIYYNGNVESKIYLRIERLNQSSSIDLPYEIFFEGELDLYTLDDGVLYNGVSTGVSCTAIEGGVSAALDAAGSTKYSIPISEADSDFVCMDGIKLRSSYAFGTLGASTNITINSGNPMPDRAISLYFIRKEGDYTSGITHNPTDTFPMGQGSFASGSTQHGNYIFEGGNLAQTQTGDVTINVTFEVTNANYVGGNSGPVKLRIKLVKYTKATNSASVIGVPFLDPVPVPMPGVRTVTATVNVPSQAIFSLQNEDRLYLTYDVVTTANALPTVGSWGFKYTANQSDAVGVRPVFRNDVSFVRFYPLRKVIDKLLTKITGQTGLLQSDYLTNTSARFHYMNPFNVRLTCGDALRGLKTNAAGLPVTPAMQISWTDMVRYLKRAHGCAIDVRNGKVVVEKAARFFDSSKIIANVGEVKSFRITPTRDLFSTAGKWGYPNAQDNKLNGKDAANTQSVWRYPITKGAEEDATVPFYADAYAIEQVRVNLANKNTIDNDGDNSIYVVETEGYTSPYVNNQGFGNISVISAYNLYRPQATLTQPSVTGLLFPETLYNLTMMPILNLYRNGGELHSLFYNMEDKLLAFTTTEENPIININLGNGTITATADIDVFNLDPAYFKPNFLNIEAVLPSTFLSAIRSIPDGCIEFTENNITYKGYPWDVGVKGPDKSTYQMILLCTEDTDLTLKAI